MRNFGTFIDLLPNLYLNCYISETFLFSVKNIDNTFIESALKKKVTLESQNITKTMKNIGACL